MTEVTAPINLGIWGTGAVASGTLAPALVNLAQARLWSVCSRQRERAETFATRFDARSPRPAHEEPVSFLADPNLHAVLLATPDRLQGPQALECLRAGKHVLLTVPTLDHAGELQDLLALARNQANVVGFGDRLIHHRGHHLIAQRLKEEVLGSLHLIRLFVAKTPAWSPSWRHDPSLARWGVLASLGASLAALLYELTKAFKPKLERIYADVVHDDHGYDRSVAAHLRWPGGPRIELGCTDLFDAQSRLEIYGERGQITAQATLDSDGHGRIETTQGPLVYTRISPTFSRLQSFVQAVQDGRSEVGLTARARFVQDLLLMLAPDDPLQRTSTIERASVAIHATMDEELLQPSVDVMQRADDAPATAQALGAGFVMAEAVMPEAATAEAVMATPTAAELPSQEAEALRA